MTIFEGIPLPPVLADLAKQLGYFVAQRLIEAYGGTRVYIPRLEHLSVNHPLSVRVGYQVALRLSRVYGGGAIPVPRGARELRAARNQMILSYRRHGLTYADIALQHQITERTVYRVVEQERANADSCQLSLPLD